MIDRVATVAARSLAAIGIAGAGRSAVRRSQAAAIDCWGYVRTVWCDGVRSPAACVGAADACCAAFRGRYRDRRFLACLG